MPKTLIPFFLALTFLLIIIICLMLPPIVDSIRGQQRRRSIERLCEDNSLLSILMLAVDYYRSRALERMLLKDTVHLSTLYTAAKLYDGTVLSFVNEINRAECSVAVDYFGLGLPASFNPLDPELVSAQLYNVASGLREYILYGTSESMDAALIALIRRVDDLLSAE